MVGIVRRAGTRSTAHRAAAEIFTYCFPLLLTDAVRRAHPTAAPQFMLVNADGAGLAPGLFEDDPRVVITSAWLNLADGPVIVRAPRAQGRHAVVNVIDTAGESFLCLDAGEGLKLALVSSSWVGELPADVVAKRTPSASCWVVCRIHADTMFDRAAATAIARKQYLEFVGRSGMLMIATDPVLEPGPMTSLRQVTELAPRLLFRRLDNLLAGAPVGAPYDEVREHVAGLRELIGGPPDSPDWPNDLHDEFAHGFAEAAAAIADEAEAAWRANGGEWTPQTPFEHADSPLGRAAHAYASLGALPSRNLLSLHRHSDRFGEQLSGASSYRIRLAPGAQPPAKAFWEMYARPPAPSQAPIGVGSRGELMVNPDGSTDLIIQHAPPEGAQVANWLPSPRGGFSLILQLHSPRAAALSGAWRMPPVERLKSVASDEWLHYRTSVKGLRKPQKDDSEPPVDS